MADIIYFPEEKKDMRIRTIGTGERLFFCSEALRCAGVFPDAELTLLPIPTTRDGKYITNTEEELDALPSSVNAGSLVAGYHIPEEIKREIRARGGLVYDAELDEEFLGANASLTANGALGYILGNFKRDLSDLRFGIVGYGRIGSRLLRRLLFLGAAVRVYTTRESLTRELSEQLIECEAIDGENDLSEIDVLINTAPDRLFSDESLRGVLSRGGIIELASGNNFEGLSGVVRLPSIPERFYPETAGKIYAERIISSLVSFVP